MWEQLRPILDAIPAGRVITYGQLAALCGYPGRARRVGSLLAQAPPEWDLPWHRVVNARGQIRVPCPQAAQEQAQRLRAEGILFEGDRVDLKRWAWRPSPLAFAELGLKAGEDD